MSVIETVNTVTNIEMLERIEAVTRSRNLLESIGGICADEYIRSDRTVKPEDDPRYLEATLRVYEAEFDLKHDGQK